MILFAKVLIIAHLVMGVGGVPLNAHLSEPNDIQPAAGYNVLQRTTTPQPAFEGSRQYLQPTFNVNGLQSTISPQQQ